MYSKKEVRITSEVGNIFKVEAELLRDLRRPKTTEKREVEHMIAHIAGEITGESSSDPSLTRVAYRTEVVWRNAYSIFQGKAYPISQPNAYSIFPRNAHSIFLRNAYPIFLLIAYSIFLRNAYPIFLLIAYSIFLRKTVDKMDTTACSEDIAYGAEVVERAAGVDVTSDTAWRTTCALITLDVVYEREGDGTNFLAFAQEQLSSWFPPQPLEDDTEV